MLGDSDQIQRRKDLRLVAKLRGVAQTLGMHNAFQIEKRRLE
jgi:hypothetical protein